jgi:hypothetical protein
MGMILTMSVESGLLRFIATGEFSLEESQRTFLEMIDAVARQKTVKILFDGRELKGDPTTIQRFLYGEFVAHTVVKGLIAREVHYAPQFAYLLQEPVLDPQRFGETVAINRGMWVQAFDHLEDALGWLELAPAITPDAGEAR